MIFLDDDKYRQAKIRSRVPSATCVETVQACIEAIEAADYINYLLLDHDLGGEIHVDSGREDCGMEVVRWLVANPEIGLSKIDTIIVHSMNAPARKQMVYDLRSASYNVLEIPFSALEIA